MSTGCKISQLEAFPFMGEWEWDQHSKRLVLRAEGQKQKAQSLELPSSQAPVFPSSQPPSVNQRINHLSLSCWRDRSNGLEHERTGWRTDSKVLQAA
jgi:hypothetical protein